jgi:hydroxymethylpyrimidine pyrophosphatase-like HAD family hydrolase
VTAPLRCVYVDLDGTLLGARGSLLHDADGAFTLLGARALEACARAGAEVVLYSGRRQLTLFHDARLMGVRSYVFEAGAGVVLDGELHWLTGDLVPRDGRTIFEQIEATGAPALLLERFAGRLEYHEPWHRGREVSHLFRGDVDAFEADALLDEAGLSHLRLVDNGTIHESAMAGIERPRAYHLVPRSASKARAVAWHMRARGHARDECIAIGDSREDLGAADVVSTFWLVANAVEKDPSIRAALGPNARITSERNGAGVYEAVVTELAERR